MSMEVVVCGWKNCDAEIEQVPGSEALYCCRTHRDKASKSRRPTSKAALSAWVWKSSGFTFAKALEGAERIAEERGASAEAVKTLMLKSLRKRIDRYLEDPDSAADLP